MLIDRPLIGQLEAHQVKVGQPTGEIASGLKHLSSAGQVGCGCGLCARLSPAAGCEAVDFSLHLSTTRRFGVGVNALLPDVETEVADLAVLDLVVLALEP